MKDKEDARSEWIGMIEKSWTWERLTEKERDRFLNVITSDHASPKGTYKERWEYCNLMSIFSCWHRLRAYWMERNRHRSTTILICGTISSLLDF